MIPLSAVQGYDLALDSLSTSALSDLRALLGEVEGMDPDRSRRVLFQAFPELFNPYAAASSEVSATFYEEIRDMSGVAGSFQADTLGDVDADRWSSLVGAGTQPRLLEQGASNLMFQFLAGGLTSIMSTMAADTIYGNASNDSEPVAYQRVPKSGCCGFCGMLASRGAAYDSEKSAGVVVGRGVPVTKGRRRRGGVAKGIRPRGSRTIGQEFHDHCKCRAVPVFRENYAEMEEDAAKYFESYAEAYSKVTDGLVLEFDQFKSADGSLKNKYRWVNSADGKIVSPKDRTKMIATAIRHDLDVK